MHSASLPRPHLPWPGAAALVASAALLAAMALAGGQASTRNPPAPAPPATAPAAPAKADSQLPAPVTTIRFPYRQRF